MNKDTIHNDSPTKLKKFIIKQRSLSTFQSKMFSTTLNNTNDIHRSQSKSKIVNLNNKNNNNNNNNVIIK